MKNDKKEKERDDSRDCLHARFVRKWDILLLNAGIATEEISPMEENEMEIWLHVRKLLVLHVAHLGILHQTVQEIRMGKVVVVASKR